MMLPLEGTKASGMTSGKPSSHGADFYNKLFTPLIANNQQSLS
jgi:hypothetical protein